MGNVEIFVTNVQEAGQANYLIGKLNGKFPDYRINFDLQDADKILRVEGDTIDAKAIITMLSSENFTCEILN